MIKMDRALRTCNFLPMQQRNILASLPAELVNMLTSKELAIVMQTLDAHWHKAQAAALENVLDEQYIWSDKANKLLDLADVSADGQTAKVSWTGKIYHLQA